MLELKITANTVEELIAQAAALAGLGVTVSGSPQKAPDVEVPLPEPRHIAELNVADPAPEEPRTKRKYTRRQPETTSGEAVSGGGSSGPAEQTVTVTFGGGSSGQDHREAAPHAAPGEVYLLAGDGYNNDGRRLTYCDGVRYSTVHKDNQGKFTVYARHAPEKPADREEAMTELVNSLEGVEPYREGEEVPEEVTVPTSAADHTAMGGAQPAEPEPATSEPATAASEDGPVTSDSGQSDEAESAPDEQPPELIDFIEKVESATAWTDVKTAMAEFYRTDVFKAFSLERQNRIRAVSWQVCAERKAEGHIKDLPDQASDLSAFRLWVEDQEDPDAIRGTLFSLTQGVQWKGANAQMHAAINGAVEARLEALG